MHPDVQLSQTYLGQFGQSYPRHFGQSYTRHFSQPWLEQYDSSCRKNYDQSNSVSFGVQIQANLNSVNTRSTECFSNSPYTRIIPRPTYIQRSFGPPTPSPLRSCDLIKYRQRLDKIGARILARELTKLKSHSMSPRAAYSVNGRDRKTALRDRESSSITWKHEASAEFEEFGTSSPESEVSLSTELIQRLIDYTQVKNAASPRSTKFVRSTHRLRHGVTVPTRILSKRHRTRLQSSEEIQNVDSSMEPVCPTHTAHVGGQRMKNKPRKINHAKRSALTKGFSTNISPRASKTPRDFSRAGGLRYRRNTEARYLSDVTKYVHDALSGQPAPCQNLLERYNYHRRAHHVPEASTETDLQPDRATQSNPRNLLLRSRERLHYNIGVGRQASRSRKISDASRNSQTSDKSDAGCSQQRQPCACPESQPWSMIARIQSIYTGEKECVCLTSGVTITEIVEDWLQQLPLRANYNKKDQEAKQNAVNILTHDLKKNLRDESKWKEIIANGFELLPVWLPPDPTERAKFTKTMQEDLLSRLRQVVTSKVTPEKYFDVFIEAFIKRLTFDRKVNKVQLLAKLNAKLRQIALTTPEAECRNAFFTAILEELSKWPVKDTTGKFTQQVQALADSLAGFKIASPKRVKPWVKVTKNEIVSIIKSWYNTLPYKPEVDVGFDIDLVSDLLADDIEVIYEKNCSEDIWENLNNVVLKHLAVLLSPERRKTESEKFVNKLIAQLYVNQIADWVEMLPFFQSEVNKEDFVNDLATKVKYLNLTSGNEVDFNTVAQTIVEKLNEFQLTCDEVETERLAVELAEALCALPKEKGFLQNMTNIIRKWFDKLIFQSKEHGNKHEIATELAINLNNILVNKLAVEVWAIMNFAVLSKLNKLPVTMTDLDKEAAAEELVNTLVAENFNNSVFSWVTSLPFRIDSKVNQEHFSLELSKQLKQVLYTEADYESILFGFKKIAIQEINKLPVLGDTKEKETLVETLTDILSHVPQEKNVIKDAIRKWLKFVPLSKEKHKNEIQIINDLARNIEDKFKTAKSENYWQVIKATAAKEIKDVVAKSETGMVGYLGEKLAKDIINNMIYDAVSSFVYIVPFPPEQEKHDIINDLVKILRSVSGDTFQDQRKEAIKDTTLAELKKKNVLCTEEELKVFVEILANKLNNLPEEKDLFNEIVRDWVKTIPFKEPPSGGLSKFTFILTIHLKMFCNGRPTTKNCRENCINAILEELETQNLKCSKEEAKEFAEQLVDKLASLLFNETINHWVKALPLKDSPPVDRDALVMKISNALRKILCEYDPEDAKNPICDEVFKMLEVLPIACDQEDAKNFRIILAETLADDLLKFPALSDPGRKLILELLAMHPAYFDLTKDNIRTIIKKMTMQYETLLGKRLTKPELEKEMKKEIDAFMTQIKIDQPTKSFIDSLLEGVIVSLSKVEMEELVKNLMVILNEFNAKNLPENENIIKQDIENQIDTLLEEKGQIVEQNAKERLANKLFQQIVISKDNLNKGNIQNELTVSRKLVMDWITQIPELQIKTSSDSKLYEGICNELSMNIENILRKQKNETIAKNKIVEEILQRLDEALEIKKIFLEPSEKRKLVYKLVDKINKSATDGIVSVYSIKTKHQNQNRLLKSKCYWPQNATNTNNQNIRKSTTSENCLNANYENKKLTRNKMSDELFETNEDNADGNESSASSDVSTMSSMIQLSGNLKLRKHDKIEDSPKHDEGLEYIVTKKINAFKDQSTFVDPEIRDSLTDEIFRKEIDLQEQTKAAKNIKLHNMNEMIEWLKNSQEVLSCSSFSHLDSDDIMYITSKMPINGLDPRDSKNKLGRNKTKQKTKKGQKNNSKRKVVSKSSIQLNTLFDGLTKTKVTDIVSDTADKENHTIDKYIQSWVDDIPTITPQSSSENNESINLTKDLSVDINNLHVQDLKHNKLQNKIASEIKKAIQSVFDKQFEKVDARVQTELKNVFLTELVDQEEPKLSINHSSLLASDSKRDDKMKVITKEIYNWMKDIPEVIYYFEQDELYDLLNNKLVEKLTDLEPKDFHNISSRKEIRNKLFALLNVLFLRQGKKINRKTKMVLLKKLIGRLNYKFSIIEDIGIKNNSTAMQKNLEPSISSISELRSSNILERKHNEKLVTNLTNKISDLKKQTKGLKEKTILEILTKRDFSLECKENSLDSINPRQCSPIIIHTNRTEPIMAGIHADKGIQNDCEDQSKLKYNTGNILYFEEIPEFTTNEPAQRKKLERICKTLANNIIEAEIQQNKVRSAILHDVRDMLDICLEKTGHDIHSGIKEILAENLMELVKNKLDLLEKGTKLSNMFQKYIFQWMECNQNFTKANAYNKGGNEKFSRSLAKHLAEAVIKESDGDTLRGEMLFMINKLLYSALDKKKEYLNTKFNLAEDLLDIVNDIAKQFEILDKKNTRKYTKTIQDCLEDLPGVSINNLVGKKVIDNMSQNLMKAIKKLNKEELNDSERNWRIKCIIRDNLNFTVIEKLKREIEDELTEKITATDIKHKRLYWDVFENDSKHTITDRHQNITSPSNSSIREPKEAIDISKKLANKITEFKKMGKNDQDVQYCVEELFNDHFMTSFDKKGNDRFIKIFYVSTNRTDPIAKADGDEQNIQMIIHRWVQDITEVFPNDYNKHEVDKMRVNLTKLIENTQSSDLNNKVDRNAIFEHIKDQLASAFHTRRRPLALTIRNILAETLLRRIGFTKIEKNIDLNEVFQNDVLQWLADIPGMAGFLEANEILRDYICQKLAKKLSHLQTTDTDEKFKRRFFIKEIKKHLDYALDRNNQNMTFRERNQWTEELLNRITTSIIKTKTEEKQGKYCEELFFANNIPKQTKGKLTRFTTEPQIYFMDVLQAERRNFQISKRIPLEINKKMLGIIAKNLDDIIRPIGHDIIHTKIVDLLVEEGGLLVTEAEEFTSFIMKQAQKLALKAIADEIYLMNLVNQEIIGCMKDFNIPRSQRIELATNLKHMVTDKQGPLSTEERKNALQMIQEKSNLTLKEAEAFLERTAPDANKIFDQSDQSQKTRTKNLPVHSEPIVGQKKMNQLLQDLAREVNVLKDTPGAENEIRKKIRQKLKEIYGDLDEDELRRKESELYHKMVEDSEDSKQESISEAKTLTKKLPADIKPIFGENKKNQLLQDLGQGVNTLKDTPGREKADLHQKLNEIYGDLDEDELRRKESELFHKMVKDTEDSKQESISEAKTLTKKLPADIKPIFGENKKNQLLLDLGQGVNTLKDTPGREKADLHQKLNEIHGNLDEDELRRKESELFHKMVKDTEDSKQESISEAKTLTKKLPADIKPIFGENKKNQLLLDLGQGVNTLKDTPGREKADLHQKLNEIHGNLDEDELRRKESELYHKMVDDSEDSKQESISEAKTLTKKLPADIKPIFGENKKNQLLQDLGQGVNILKDTPGREKAELHHNMAGDGEDPNQNPIDESKAWIKSLPSNIKPIVGEKKMNQLMQDLGQEVNALKDTPGGEKKIRQKIREKLIEMYGDLNEDELRRLENDLYHKLVGDAEDLKRKLKDESKASTKSLSPHIKPTVSDKNKNQLVQDLSQDFNALKDTPGGEEEIRKKNREKLTEMYGDLDEDESRRLENVLYHKLVGDDEDLKRKSKDESKASTKGLSTHFKPIVSEKNKNQLVQDLSQDFNALKDTPGGEEEIRKKIREKLTEMYGDLDEDELRRLENDLYHNMVGNAEDLKKVSDDKNITSLSKSPAQCIEEWCNSLPVQGDPENVKAIKQNLVSTLLNRIGELNLNPDIFNDKELYRDILLDEIQKSLLDVPKNPELDMQLPALVQDLIANILRARQTMLNEQVGKSYKAKLKNAIHNTLPLPCRLPRHEAAELELLKDKIADAFIHLRIAKQCDRICSFGQRISSDIEKFYNNISNYYLSGPDIYQFGKDTHKALLRVPAPRNDIIKSEFEQAGIRNVITKWMETLPLRPESGTEKLHRHKLAAILAKQLYDIEIEKEHNPQFEVDPKMSEEVLKFLKKIPLNNADSQIPQLAQNLISALKESQSSRKFIPLKCTTFDETKCACCLSVGCQVQPGDTRQRDLSLGSVSRRIRPIENEYRSSVRSFKDAACSCKTPSLTRNSLYCPPSGPCTRSSTTPTFPSCHMFDLEIPARCRMATRSRALGPSTTSTNCCLLERSREYRNALCQTTKLASSCGVGPYQSSRGAQYHGSVPSTRECFRKFRNIRSGCAIERASRAGLDAEDEELYAEDIGDRREIFGSRVGMRNPFLSRHCRISCSRLHRKCFQR